MEFKKKYSSANEVLSDLERAGLSIKAPENTDILKSSIYISENISLENHLCCHPMEGADGKHEDGAPGELTFRRYGRFAKGGAGIIWFEAMAVTSDGRANPRQLWINEKNLGEFERIVYETKETAFKENNCEIKVIAQLTHSGRQSRPYDKPRPIISAHIPIYEETKPVSDDAIITDSELDRLQEDFERAALLSEKAGFDGCDIKSCHGYLLAELAGGFGRQGKYGGDYEGRLRFYKETIARTRSAVGKAFEVTSRLGVYDGIKGGFGVDKDDPTKYDLREPKRLIKELYDGGMRLINITMGNPYFNPHINRPYNSGGYVPPEHPIIGVARIINGAVELQKHVPDMTIVLSGITWLGEFAPIVAAGIIEENPKIIAGFGRTSFAYPDFANDIIRTGGMNKSKICIMCSKCTQLMRAGCVAGCPVRDKEVYLPLYKENVK